MFAKTFVSAAFFCACLLPGLAQTRHEAESKARSIAVTGCLKKGTTVDRFILTGRDGKVYALRSTSVRLSEQIGHRVAIKGNLKHDQQRDDYDFEGSELGEGYGKSKTVDPIDVEVISLKVVGESCR